MTEDEKEWLFFETKKYFVSSPIIPALYAKKLKSTYFQVTNNSIEINYNWPNQNLSMAILSMSTNASIIDIIRKFEKESSQNKLAIMNASSIEALVSLVNNLINLQLAYEELLLNYFKTDDSIKESLANEVVKIADAVSSAEIVRILQSESENVALLNKEYCRIKKHKALVNSK
jgi:hypothetical protein